MSMNIPNAHASVPLKILGMGKYLPPRTVPSSILEAQMGLKPGWILQK